MPFSENKFFDPRPELTAIKEYLATRWDNLPSDFWTVLTFIGNVACRDGLRYVDNHCVWTEMRGRVEAREALLADKLLFDGAEHYDRPLVAMNAFMDANLDFAKALRDQPGVADYSKRMDELTREIVSFSDAMTDVRPKGWTELRKAHFDSGGSHEGQDDYCEHQLAIDQAAYAGTPMATLTGGDFIYRTALPYVLDDDVSHGRDPLRSLVAAVYTQISLLCEQFNTVQLVQAVRALSLNEDAPNLVLDLPRPVVDNAHLRALLAFMDIKTPDAFRSAEEARLEWDKAIAFRAEWKALSPEEKAARRKKAEADMSAFMSSLPGEIAREGSVTERFAGFYELLKAQAPELVAFPVLPPVANPCVGLLAP